MSGQKPSLVRPAAACPFNIKLHRDVAMHISWRIVHKDCHAFSGLLGSGQVLALREGVCA